MKLTRCLFVLQLALYACVSLASTQPESADAHHRAVDAIFEKFDRPGSPGAALGIVRNGEVEYVRTYGSADLENETPITQQTMFDIASVSKQFTAYAVLLLVRDGKVNLEADIRQYLPYMPDYGWKITPRHLLQHTSGLREQFRLLELAGHDERSPTSQQQVLNLVKRQRALNFEPGTQFEYCNTGYILLAEIVHAVSGTSLRQFAQERIFEPLGMTHSLFYDDSGELISHRAYSYERSSDSTTWRRFLDSYSYVGPTGVQTTIGDLLKWAVNMARPRAGDAEIFRQMTTWGLLNDGTQFNYGMGLAPWEFAGERSVHHSGTIARFGLLFAHFPERDFSVALLMNTDENKYSYLDRVVAAYFDADGSRRAARERAAGFAEAQVKDSLLRAAAGDYMNPNDLVLSLAYRDGRLFLQERGGEPVPVRFRKNGRFDGSYPQWRSYRLRERAGKIVGLEAYIDDRPMKYFERVVTTQWSAEEMARIAGSYFSDEVDSTVTITFDGRRLLASTIWMDQPTELYAVTPERFETDNAVLHAVLLDRDAQGRVSSIRIDCYGGLKDLPLLRVDEPPAGR